MTDQPPQTSETSEHLDRDDPVEFYELLRTPPSSPYRPASEGRGVAADPGRPGGPTTEEIALVALGAAYQPKWWVAGSVIVVFGFVIGASLASVSSLVAGPVAILGLIGLVLAGIRRQPSKSRTRGAVPPRTTPPTSKG